MEKANWNLDDIFKLDDFEALYSETQDLIDKYDDIFESLSPDMSEADFQKYTDHHEKTMDNLHKLGCRPALMEAADQKDTLAVKLKNKVKDLEIRFSEKVQPVSLWLKGKQVGSKQVLDDKNAQRLFASTPDIEYVYSYSRLMGKYSLDEKSENIMTAKDANGISVITDLRDMIETEFEFDFKPEGGERKIIKNNAEISGFAYSPNPAERKAAFQARLEQYQKNIDKFFVAYQAVVKDWNYEAKLRGFSSSISMRNVANHVEDEPINTLMDVCTKNVDIFQNYFKFKAAELGYEKLTRFDVYAPLDSTTEKIDYNKAIEYVKDSFSDFSENFANKAMQIIQENHVDSHPTDTKRGGAFCMTVTPAITPYVLLNYAGKMRDVSTLAHELGHGVHSLYANRHSISSQHATLPLAETASTLGEMILFERIIAETNDNQLKKQLLSDKLADSYATVCRQNYIVKFEIAAHEAIQKGIEEKDLSEMWLNNLKEQFGDSVEVDDIFRYEWAYIPHIVHTPFYCYAYNFGELLSMALYAKYKKEGNAFVPKIEEILAAGGSEDPKDILARVGIDMNSAEFWQGSFELIRAWQQELETL